MSAIMVKAPIHTKSTRRRWVVAIAIAALWSPSVVAEPTTSDYVKLLDEAKRAHEGGDHGTCAERYQRAYVISADANLLYNQAVCLFDGGKDQAARDAIERFLATNPPADVKSEAQSILTRIQSAKQRQTQAARALQERRDVHTSAAIGLAATSGVLLLVAGGLTGHSSNQWSAAKEACPGLERCPDDRGRSLSKEAGVFADTATAIWAVGGVAAVASLVVWLTTPDKGGAGSVSVSVSPWPAGGAGIVFGGSL